MDGPFAMGLAFFFYNTPKVMKITPKEIKITPKEIKITPKVMKIMFKQTAEGCRALRCFV